MPSLNMLHSACATSSDPDCSPSLITPLALSPPLCLLWILRCPHLLQYDLFHNVRTCIVVHHCTFHTLVTLLLLLSMMVDALFCPCWHPTQSMYHHLSARHRVSKHLIVMEDINHSIICRHIHAVFFESDRTLLLLFSAFCQSS